MSEIDELARAIYIAERRGLDVDSLGKEWDTGQVKPWEIDHPYAVAKAILGAGWHRSAEGVDGKDNVTDKPWSVAEPGEVWWLVDKSGFEGQYLHEEGRFFRLPFVKPQESHWKPASFASDFTEGVRLWPGAAA